jgi:hypothetical protein
MQRTDMKPQYPVRAPRNISVSGAATCNTKGNPVVLTRKLECNTSQLHTAASSSDGGTTAPALTLSNAIIKQFSCTVACTYRIVVSPSSTAGCRLRSIVDVRLFLLIFLNKNRRLYYIISLQKQDI